MRSALLVSIITLLVLTSGIAHCAPGNLFPNPGFELGTDASGIPADWWLWEQDHGKVKCSIDTAVFHSGARSFRMDVPEGGFTLLVNHGIPVAVGEKFKISVWVRAVDTKAEKSDAGVVVNAAFRRDDGKFINFHRFGKPIPSGDWTQLSATVTVPEETSTMTVELGLKGTAGTVWFDDVSVIAKSLCGIRPAKGATELPPGSSNWPLDIINRTGDKRAARIVVTADDIKATQDIRLDGSSPQQVKVSIQAGAPRLENFKLRLMDPASGAVLAESNVGMRIVDGVELEPLVPTHFCIEDGSPSLEARVWNHIPPEEVEKIEVVLKDANGTSLFTNTLHPQKTGWTDVTLASANAGLGEYRVEATLYARDGKTYSDAQPWHIIHRSQARVTIDDSGFPVADGKPIFPLGTFNSGRYELMKNLGFTVTHAWNRMKLAPEGDRTNNQDALNYLDETEKAGMKAIGFLHVAYMERQDWAELRRRIRMFRNHPALLAWDQEEGVARGEVPMSRLEKLVKIVREEDPNHPFVMADSYDVITKVDRSRFFRNDLMDIGMWWYYPIPLNTGNAAAALEGRDESDSLVLNPPSFMVSTTKPEWVGMQAYVREGGNGRIPTDAEYRCMAYLVLCSGAKGLLYYMGGSAWRVEGMPDERPWGYLDDLIPELSAMIPTIMAPTAPDKVSIAPETAKLATLLKLKGNTYTLITVNRSDKNVDAVFNSGCFRPGGVEVLFEKREVSSDLGTLRDTFGPYAVHVYRWSR